MIIEVHNNIFINNQNILVLIFIYSFTNESFTQILYNKLKILYLKNRNVIFT